VSRRKRPTETSSPPAAGPPPARRRVASPGFLVQIAILVAVLAVVTLIAELAGAANLGVSISIGSIAFTVVLMYFILKR
jgi:hypothetical protein